jgi:hypothetical protein
MKRTFCMTPDRFDRKSGKAMKPSLRNNRRLKFAQELKLGRGRDCADGLVVAACRSLDAFSDRTARECQGPGVCELCRKSYVD